jgi:hypothetical protein
MMSQTRTPPATMARNPRTTMTAIAQRGKAELLLGCWMLPDGEADEDSGDMDATDALDATEADERAERAERLDCTEREDCDMEATTESAYVV